MKGQNTEGAYKIAFHWKYVEGSLSNICFEEFVMDKAIGYLMTDLWVI